MFRVWVDGQWFGDYGVGRIKIYRAPDGGGAIESGGRRSFIPGVSYHSLHSAFKAGRRL